MTAAQQDIEAAVQRARVDLRRESADLAIAVATRIVRENMDVEKNRRLAESLIEEAED